SYLTTNDELIVPTARAQVQGQQGDVTHKATLKRKSSAMARYQPPAIWQYASSPHRAPLY
ncbi:MAG: hypothetical protein ACTSW2_05160, partial [Alphaproteobacteria bacterium]